MPRVLVHHDLPIASSIEGRREDLTCVAADDVDAVLSLLPESDAFVVNPASWDDAFLDALEEGDWVQATSVGYDAFPLDDFRERGVTFTNAKGNYAPVVADHTFAMALAFSRGLPTLLEKQRARDWDRSIGLALTDWTGRRLTVYGLGTIGESIARRGLGFEMDVYGVKRDPHDYDGCLPADRVLGPDRFHEVLSGTDLLVAIVPLTDETRHAIDAAVFERLPDSALVVNVARGAVVEESALLDALDDGEIAGAALDVFESEPLPPDSPLWEREDVLVTPHVAGRSDRFAERFSALFLDNYDRWRQGEPLVNEVVGGRGGRGA